MDLAGKKVDNLIEVFDIDALDRSKKLRLQDLRCCFASMPNLREVIMYDLPFDYADVEALIADFPHITFRYTVRINKMHLVPGATAYSTLKGRQEPRYTADDLSAVLYRFCPDLLALDAGHNNVSDLSFLRAWPGLRRLIVVDSKVHITDISPLADLPDLEYVELFMQDITDISPLAGKTRLLDLNLCHNNITDLTPLYSCTNLQRLWISHNPHLPQSEIDALQAALPDCHIEYKVYGSTDAGWRDHPRYQIMYDSFVQGVYIPFD